MSSIKVDGQPGREAESTVQSSGTRKSSDQSPATSATTVTSAPPLNASKYFSDAHTLDYDLGLPGCPQSNWPSQSLMPICIMTGSPQTYVVTNHGQTRPFQFHNISKPHNRYDLQNELGKPKIIRVSNQLQTSTIKEPNMTGYTVHTGATEKFVQGWDQIFKKKQPAKAAKAPPPSAPAKKANKKANKK